MTIYCKYIITAPRLPSAFQPCSTSRICPCSASYNFHCTAGAKAPPRWSCSYSCIGCWSCCKSVVPPNPHSASSECRKNFCNQSLTVSARFGLVGAAALLLGKVYPACNLWCYSYSSAHYMSSIDLNAGCHSSFVGFLYSVEISSDLKVDVHFHYSIFLSSSLFSFLVENLEYLRYSILIQSWGRRRCDWWVSSWYSCYSPF